MRAFDFQRRSHAGLEMGAKTAIWANSVRRTRKSNTAKEIVKTSSVPASLLTVSFGCGRHLTHLGCDQWSNVDKVRIQVDKLAAALQTRQTRLQHTIILLRFLCCEDCAASA